LRKKATTTQYSSNYEELASYGKVISSTDAGGFTTKAIYTK
jgi:hypothetical protein